MSDGVERFEVRKCGLVFKLFDTKIGDFLDICADYDALVEVARVCNNLERKNRCCQRKVDVLVKFADPVEVNRYWEMMTNG
jgi:hypothetical protein